MSVVETERLVLRRLEEDDAEFIQALVNDPDWLRFIGDRNVRTAEDARAFIRNGPVAMYARVGFGLYMVEQKADGVPVGICGLIRRDALEDVDVGFAFLPRFRGLGYALEAAAATLEYGRTTLGLGRIVAIVSPGNEASERLLARLGMAYEGTVQLSEGGEVLRLFGREMQVGPADVTQPT